MSPFVYVHFVYGVQRNSTFDSLDEAFEAADENHDLGAASFQRIECPDGRIIDSPEWLAGIQERREARSRDDS